LLCGFPEKLFSPKALKPDDALGAGGHGAPRITWILSFSEQRFLLAGGVIMGKKTIGLLACLLALGGLWGWTSPAQALYPPAQSGFTASRSGNTINYSVTDPFTNKTVSGSWTLDLAGGVVDDPVVSGGIVAWRSGNGTSINGQFFYDTVYYRIYDPGRGKWMAGQHSMTVGYNRFVYPLKVGDGVVAFKTEHQVDPDPSSDICWGVTCVTYNPVDGTWPEDNYALVVPNGSDRTVENLRVQDGVVAWPNTPLDNNYDVHMRIFDPQLQQWIGHDLNWSLILNLDWIEIENGTVHVRGNGYWSDEYYIYDMANHSWEDSDQYICAPFAYFVAWPYWGGYPPLKVCFWDQSIAVDGASWAWNFGEGGFSSDRSPVYTYNAPGNYTATLLLPQYQGEDRVYQYTINVKPVPTFTGGIQINGGATYTNSMNVSLALQFSSPTGAQMRFHNPLFSPLLNNFWFDWQPYSPTASWSFFYPFDGEHSVTVQFQDINGFLSDTYSASIILDTTPPAGTLTLNDGQATTNNPNVRVQFSATDANGVSQMRWRCYNEGDNLLPPWTWKPYAATDTTVKFDAKPGNKVVDVQFQDVAGNISEYQKTIWLKSRALPFLNLLLH
jgi:PKD repeat protein